MRIYNSYILTVAAVLLLTAVIMIASGIGTISLYYIIYVLEALIITELYVHFSVRARHSLGRIELLLFAGFLVFLSAEVIRILK